MTKIKEKWRRGEPVFLVRMAFNSPKMVEFIAQFGFDAVLIDCEHTSASVSCVEEMVRAARASGIAAIVRPEILNESIITRYLDCKADGIMAPHVDDAAGAKMLCSIVKYARPLNYQDLVLIAMIESKQAIENLDDILAVDGIDSFFLARVDLSKSLGLGGDKKSEIVRKVVDAAVARISAKGLIAGAAGDMDNVADVIARGARLIFVTVEDMVRYGCETYLKAVGQPLEG
jgi:4-hydroxy-2-oxoheptanedioate aldolase